MKDFEIIDRYGRRMSSCERRMFGRCRFKGGGSTTVNNTSTYTPTEYELQLQKAQSDYANAIAPNSLWLNDTARNILQNSIGAVQVDFNRLNNQAQNQIAQATQGLSAIPASNMAATNTANSALGGLSGQYAANAANTNRTLGGLSGQYAANAANTNRTLGALANGQLPTGYQNAMQQSIASALQNTMGGTLNGLAQRGVLNSSVTNQAMNDIAKNAANTVAQQYQGNINTVAGLTNQQNANTNTALGQQANIANQQSTNTANALGHQESIINRQNANTLSANSANAGIYGNLIGNATSGTAAAAAAQEGAQQPAINLWNASLGLNGATTGALAAAAGKGTTSSTSTQSTHGGGGLLSGLLGGIL